MMAASAPAISVAGSRASDVASVPANVINQWLDEEYARGNVDLRWGSKEFMALVARKLADHDWLFLRTDL